MKRKYPERPIVAVRSVVFRGQQVLLVKRNHPPRKGLWSLPGGAVELGETLVEAIKREIKEEVSIDVEIGGLVGVYERIIPDAVKRIKYHYVLIDYWGATISGQARARSDISEVQWVFLDDLDSLGLGDEVRETILKAIKLRGHGTNE